MKALRPLALSVALCFLLLAVNAEARTIHVNGAVSQSGDGSTWATALSSLTDALDTATSGDHIWVAAGTYTPGAERTATFRLKEGVEVYGGFAGNETELTKRDTKKHQATLSGDIGQMGVPEDNVFHVVTGADNSVLDGFTITGGYSANTGWDGPRQLSPTDITSGYHQGMGAGMLNFKAAPEVRNCVFQDNHALVGGAVYSMTSTPSAPTDKAPTSPKFIDCVFWQNSALAHGGGAANFLRTSPLFVSCVFDSNIADIKGGGIYNDFGAAPILLNTIFRNNEAEFGGGMANDGGAQPVLYYSTFTGNRTTKSGPAIHQDAGQPNTTVLLKTIVWGNECECTDNRFFNGEMSVIRVQDSVIQGGYVGKSVFQANPSLDRQSETMLNVGYKTNGHRFRASKLPYRIKDIERFEIAKNLPAYDTAYVAVVDPKLISAKATKPQSAPIPVQAAIPATTPAHTPVKAAPPPPERTPAPVASTKSQAANDAPTASATPAPVVAAPVVAAPIVSEPATTPTPARTVAPTTEPEALAMVEPHPSVLDKPAPRPDGPPSPDFLMLDMDMDGNGCITINEAKGPIKQRFWHIDHSGDGCINKKELERMDARRKKNTLSTQAAPSPAQRPTPRQSRTAAPKPTTTAALAPVAPAVQPTRPATASAVTRSSGPSTGYTLFAPIGGRETYLIDMNGTPVKTWTGKDRSSGAVYLLNNGNLLRSVSPAKGEVRTPFEGQGTNGGIIQEISPRGQVVWEYTYVDDKVRQHHDIEPLPNGNVLLLAWELKNSSQIAAAGGSVRNHPDGKLWVEHIVEVRKSGPRTGYVVWEWHAWDHLVQDSDSSAPNHANPVRLPQRINLNYNPMRNADWQHANSIAYNPVANQILLSLHSLNEIWVIDHSTTTEQAATNTGGRMRRGGDLLFRWGNPATYGGTGQQILNGQHDATWITGIRPGEESILIFNNGDRRTKKSDVIEIKPAYYHRTTQLTAQIQWSYNQHGGKPFYADHISGAQRLANGNTLICDGTGARLFEVTPNGETVWEYQHGTSDKGPGNHIFRATRIPATHPGLKRLNIQ